jgi:hypothetical protein
VQVLEDRCRRAAPMRFVSTATVKTRSASERGTGGTITTWCSPPESAPLRAGNVRRSFRAILTVYRKQIRPVVIGGAEVMDSLFPRRDADG